GWPRAGVREGASGYGVGVPDLRLSAVGGGVSGTVPGPLPSALRAALTMLVRQPDSAQEGNLTAGVMVDLPLGGTDEPGRLRVIADRTRRLHSPTRALASRFVVQTVSELMPPPVHRWFARTVYGGRYFHAVVSNMPGPQAQVSMAGVPVLASFPVLPLAPDAPLAVGALGWQEQLCIGIATDPGVFPDPQEFAAALHAVFDQLR